jgi:hypothetical protein
MSARGRIGRWLRAPLLHFAALGSLLFALFGSGAPAPLAPERPRQPIVVGTAQVEALLAAYARATGLAPTGHDARALVAREIDEEVLYREALALGLGEADRGVQWRMIEKMTFLSHEDVDADREELLDAARDLGLSRGDPIVRRILVERMRLALRHAGNAAAPDEAALAAYLEAHRERFVQPARVRTSQVFLARERRADLAGDAAALLGSLRRDGVGPEAAGGRGDPLPLASAAAPASERELAARFGADFAAAVAALEPGRWSEPIASVYGLHLVWVHERIPERMPSLAEVAGPVAYGLAAERRERALAEGMARLRARYEIHVEWPPALVASAGGEPAS